MSAMASGVTDWVDSCSLLSRADAVGETFYLSLKYQSGCEASLEMSVTWGPLWSAQLSSLSGYCCYSQGQYHNMERATEEKRAALPRFP